MILVKGIPFNIDIYNWVDDGRSKAVRFSKKAIKDDCIVFKYLLDHVYEKEKKDDQEQEMLLDFGNQKTYRKYSDLSLFMFMEFMNILLEVATGISKEFKISLEYSVDDIEKEVDVIEHVIMTWIHFEGWTEDQFGPIDRQFVDEKSSWPNQTFAFYMYYYVKEIRARIEKLKKIDLTQLEEMQYNIPTVEKTKKFLKDMIIIKFDLNDFIIETMDMIKDSTMTDNHAMIAIHMYDKLFTKKIPKCESWRRMYARYFDKDSDNFESFWKAHMNHCIVYLLRDYINWTLEVEYIEFYNIYTTKDYKYHLNDLSILVSIEEFEKRKKTFFKDVKSG